MGNSYDKPIDNENTLHIEADYQQFTFKRLEKRIKEKWPDAQLDQITIEPHNFKTSGCSCHPEPSDYTSYFIIRRMSAEEAARWDDTDEG